MTGTLFLVGTPIGNLGDLAPRAVETLAAVDLIAAEDTRRTGRLLAHLELVDRPLLSFFEGNERERTEEVLRRLRDGRDRGARHRRRDADGLRPGLPAGAGVRRRGHRRPRGARAVGGDRRARDLAACRPIGSCSRGSCRGRPGSGARDWRRSPPTRERSSSSSRRSACGRCSWRRSMRWATAPPRSRAS